MTVASDVQVGDEMLMPDGVTWCGVGAIRYFGDQLMFELEPAGFSWWDQGQTVQVRKSAVHRLKHTQETIDAVLWGLVQRPGLYATNLRDAVTLLNTYRWILHLLSGTPSESMPNWIRWYAKEYPDVPGETRDMVTGIQHKWHDENDHLKRFTEEATRALLELEGMSPPEGKSP